MDIAMATTASRRDVLSRLLLALAVALTLGTTVAPEVDAKKVGKNTIASIKSRVKNEIKNCKDAGGKATVTQNAGKSKTVACTGVPERVEGAGDYTCVVHSKGTRCHATRVSQPGSPLGDVTAPPAEDANENPTGGGGGNNAGDGTVAPPPTEADPDGGEPEEPTLG
jgi:hypothetical protein